MEYQIQKKYQLSSTQRLFSETVLQKTIKKTKFQNLKLIDKYDVKYAILITRVFKSQSRHY
jgi:hypothetical protein